jgi:hypothetical protein
LDSKRLEFLTECKQLAINKWLVQLIYDDIWYTKYFDDPPSGVVEDKAASKLDALNFVIDLAMQKAYSK